MLTFVQPAAPPPLADETWPALLPAALSGFMDYWRSLPGARPGVPSRRDFDFAAIPSLVPRLVLIDVAPTAGPGQFRFRFMGSWHLLTFGQELTGKTSEDLDADAGTTQVTDAYRRIAAAAVPHYWRRASVFRGFQFVTYQRVLAPLADDAGRVSALVGCFELAED